MLVEYRPRDRGRLTDKQVRDETISFFIAGHATIASALTWTWVPALDPPGGLAAAA